MKINEVEKLVGITSRNIRFYEKEGLLTPARNSQNGYREYGEAEVEELKKIKLLRKLGVPLGEIRRMQAGSCTVADGMRRHLVTLEREQHNLAQAMELCRRLEEKEIRLSELDAQAWLSEMEAMEQMGTTFQNKQREDVKAVRYVAPTVAAVCMIGLMAAAIALMVWAYHANPAEAPPLVVVAVLIAIPGAVILGTAWALVQRWNEIRGREQDEAKKY